MPDITTSKHCECGDITTIIIDKNNPTGITTVTGEYPSRGFKGDIEVEYAASGSVFTLKTRRYRFSGANQGQNQRFEVRFGPILAIEPIQNGQWINWPSSMDVPYYPPGMIFTFLFNFHVDPCGTTRYDRKGVILK
ncbi:hypothetical protein [Pseudomonas sp. R4-39-08]|uniref:hypothetical protein n=1 Tax=Pseudomonas sp. R4-39-08 TaxID=1173288 RepID=UPI000F58232B|nr:hypothetical protein [Pseudomonas sp. R4-39-08]